MPKAFVTKVKPGSISEAIAFELIKKGYMVDVAPMDWDIRTDELDLSEYDVLVNTAGVTNSMMPHEWEQPHIDTIIGVNLSGAIRLTANYVFNRKDEEGESTIIHIGSLWSRKHATNGAVYCASKAGLAHFISCMGYDLNLNYGRKFTIVGIHPGNVVGTPMTSQVQANIKASRPDINVDALYNGCITPKEVAQEVIRCIGNRWLSGENIYLGGGDKR